MNKVDDQWSTGVTAPASGFGGRLGSGARRVPIAEVLVVSLLVLIVVPILILGARNQAVAELATVTLRVQSDPTDASVIIDDLWVGRTPLAVKVERGQEIALRVEAREPYLEYDLYKPYRTTLSLEDDRNLSVWIPRTTAEEQAAQQAARR